MASRRRVPVHLAAERLLGIEHVAATAGQMDEVVDAMGRANARTWLPRPDTT